MRAVGRELYNVEITSEVLEVTAETIEGVTQDHVTFRLRAQDLTTESSDALNEKIQVDSKKQSEIELDGKESRLLLRRRGLVSVENLYDLNLSYPESTIINGKIFCDLFPFHVVFDKDLIIKQCGTKLQKMSGKYVCS